MKKLIAMALIFLLIFNLLGCSHGISKPKDVRQEIWDESKKYYSLLSEHYLAYNPRIIETKGCLTIDVNQEYLDKATNYIDDLTNLAKKYTEFTESEKSLYEDLLKFSSSLLILEVQPNLMSYKWLTAYSNGESYEITQDLKDYIEAIKSCQNNSDELAKYFGNKNNHDKEIFKMIEKLEKSH